MDAAAATTWPELTYSAWRDTAGTLQLWTQIVGKVRLALTPWLNHSWQVPLYVIARGLGTSPIPAGSESSRSTSTSSSIVCRAQSRGDERRWRWSPKSSPSSTAG